MVAISSRTQTMRGLDRPAESTIGKELETPDRASITPVVSTGLAILAVVAVVFVIEIVIMLTLARFGHATLSKWVMVVDAGLLAVVSAPFVFLLVRSLVRYEHDSRLIAERKAAALGKLAMTDWLTQVLNRHGIESALLESMALSERYGHVLSIALVDIDHFKVVNDTYGHEAGDRVLMGLANLLSHGVRSPDKLGRYGGEEFLLVFPETDLDSSLTLVERIRSTVAKTELDVGSKKIRTTVSIGVCQFQPGEGLRDLTRRVDGAMYDAKREGRNRVVSR